MCVAFMLMPNIIVTIIPIIDIFIFMFILAVDVNEISVKTHQSEVNTRYELISAV